MKNFLTIIGLISFAIVALISCDHDCVGPAGIYGEWIWTHSEGFAHFTPKEAGYTKKLIIDDFIYKEYKNDTLRFESQYDLVIRTDSVSGERKFIVFELGGEYLMEINEDELVLDPLAPDAPIDYYKRK